nr:non-structural maintenance of chromosomes element 4 like a [Quercus suber]
MPTIVDHFPETRDDLLRNNDDGLRQTINKANKIYKSVKQTNDAISDSRLLVNVSDLASKKTAQLALGDGSTGIDVDEFLSKFLSLGRHSGSHSVENPALASSQRPQRRHRDDSDDDDQDQDHDAMTESLDWEYAGRMACLPSTRRPPVPSFLLGPLSVERRVRTQTQRRARQHQDVNSREARPEALTRQDLQQSDENGLTAICSRIRKHLAAHCQRAEATLQRAGFESAEQLNSEQGRRVMRKCRITATGGPSLFDYVVNPRSFGQTVENLFYVSFLIKEGAFGIQHDDDGLPTVVPSQASTLNEQRLNKTTKRQAVFALDYATWRSLIEAFDIRESMIEHRTGEESATPVARVMAQSATTHNRRSHEQSLRERRAELLGRVQNAAYMPKLGDKVIRFPQTDFGSSHVTQGRKQTTSAPNLKPLIDDVADSWRDVKRAVAEDSDEDDEPRLQCCTLENESGCLPATYSLTGSRRFRKMLAIVVGVLLASYCVWKWTLRPRFLDAQKMKNGFVVSRVHGSYGIARGGDYDGTRIRELNAGLVPGNSNDVAGQRRLIFVGDIHGCIHELSTLLKKVDFNEERDHLIAVGDVVSKGPDTIAVLDELIRLKADTVRGNHEDRLIVMAKDMTLSDSSKQAQDSTNTSEGAEKDATLLRRMKSHHIRYLQDMPLMLRVPVLPHAFAPLTTGSHITNEIVIVHAGLVPHVPLTKQDPYFVMNMRSIDHRTHIPSATRAGKSGRGKPWYEIWNWYNDRISHGRSMGDFIRLDEDNKHDAASPKAVSGWFIRLWQAAFGSSRQKISPQVVIYGHDSKAGLQLHQWSKGLDSGCVSGGALTALVLDDQGKQEIMSVNWRRVGVPLNSLIEYSIRLVRWQEMSRPVDVAIFSGHASRLAGSEIPTQKRTTASCPLLALRPHYASLLQGALVFNCTPCHFLISSPSTLFTSRCCLITGRPANCDDTMSSAYIEPQPPEMSCTCL